MLKLPSKVIKTRTLVQVDVNSTSEGTGSEKDKSDADKGRDIHLQGKNSELQNSVSPKVFVLTLFTIYHNVALLQYDRVVALLPVLNSLQYSNLDSFSEQNG